jgi:virginiamycin B lyase
MSDERTRRRRRVVRAVVTAVLVSLALPATAGAFVYWANGTTIGRANLDGSGVDQSFITGAAAPAGVAVDGEHIYWVNTDSIARANLDGTGVLPNFITGAGAPAGVAVDAQHVYWSNYTGGMTGTIGRANLDGSGADQSFITGAAGAAEVAVDGEHVYWANPFDNTIGRANLDGLDINQSFIATDEIPTGVAVDRQYVYWTNQFAHTIGRANIDGTGANQDFITGAGAPAGVAVDGEHVYWANFLFFGGGSAIGRADLDGTDANQRFITGTNVPEGVAVDSLQPSATTVACVPATLTLSETTTCTAFVSRTAGGGARAASGEVAFSSTGAGSFSPVARCALVATGARESACQLTYTPSAAGIQTITGAYSGDTTHAPSEGGTALAVKASNAFTLAKPKLHKRKGTATLIARVPGPGRLVVEGKRIKRRAKTAKGAGNVKLAVKPTGRTRRKLRKSGKAPVRAKVTYTPTGGDPNTKSKRVKLKLV